MVVTGCVSVILQSLQELNTSTTIDAGLIRPAAIAHHKPLHSSFAGTGSLFITTECFCISYE